MLNQEIKDKKDKLNNKNSFIDKYLMFFKKTIWWWFLGMIFVVFLQFFFMLVILFLHKIASGMSAIEYIFIISNICLLSILLYPSYIYSNKTFILAIGFLIAQILFLVFLVPVSIFYPADIQNIRTNNISAKIVIHLTKEQYIYTSASLWLCFIFIGISFILSILSYYYISKLSTKPWRVRIESERVISKPKN